MTPPPSRRSRYDIDSDALVAFTQALVRRDSVHAPENGRNEAAAAALVADQMRRFGWHPQLEKVAPGRPNVVTVVDGGLPGSTLLFAGHTDVVTAGPRELWTVDPFGAEIREGRIYGRGSADMKAGVAAMLFAVDAVQRRGPFPGRIALAAFVDEEGMMLGAKRFCESPLASEIDAAIICEPEGGEVCTAQKGSLRLRLDAGGRMAHGAMPEHGINPAPALAGFIRAIAQLEEELQQGHGAHPLLGKPYLTPTVIRAGEEGQLNVIPGAAWLAIDVRTIPGIDHLALVERLRDSAAAIAAATGVAVELSVIDDRPSTQTSVGEPLVRAVVAAHSAVTGRHPVIGGVPGATDGTILHRYCQVPVVVCGPGDKWIAHQADEWVAVDDVLLYADLYADAAVRYLASQTAAWKRQSISSTAACAIATGCPVGESASASPELCLDASSVLRL